MENHIGLVLVNNERETLFVRRSWQKSTLPGAWAFPSGTVEAGEDLARTAIREAKEELNVEVENPEHMATQKLEEFNVRLHFVMAKLAEGEEVVNNEPEEIAEMTWMTFDDFFETYDDDQIGHGLIWLRQNPEVWQGYNL